MHDRMISLRTRSVEMVRRFMGGGPNRDAGPPLREPHHLERIASCACSGYFHAGYTLDAFVFNPELPFRN